LIEKPLENQWRWPIAWIGRYYVDYWMKVLLYLNGYTQHQLFFGPFTDSSNFNASSKFSSSRWSRRLNSLISFCTINSYMASARMQSLIPIPV
jgi:hypothetical protein